MSETNLLLELLEAARGGLNAWPEVVYPNEAARLKGIEAQKRLEDAIRMVDAYFVSAGQFRPLTEDECELMTLEDFKSSRANGETTPDDGSAYFATKTHVSDVPAFGSVETPEWAVQVAYYNK